MRIKGFTYAAAAAGIRKKDRLDVGLIHSDVPARLAGVFTTNRVKAAPLLLDMERLRSRGKARAVLVNSGIANACTGEPGMADALASSRLVADQLGIDPDLVQVASTGVIGEPLDVDRFAGVMEPLVAGLAPEKYDRVAAAIMTTDTVPKTAARTVSVNGTEIKLFGLAKGSGMIMPNMATMLGFVMTDAVVAGDLLQLMLRDGVDRSFNRITVDGDTSTNDMVLLLANGRAGNPEITTVDSQAGLEFGRALDGLLADLALQIVADGEGVTKVVTIKVRGGRNDREALAAARTVANSALVKTAFFGEDANWGRIIAALGRSEAVFAPEQVEIAFDDVVMVRSGLGLGAAVEARATEVLKQPRFTVGIDLHAGSGEGIMHTGDFSLDYIRINADYRS